MRRAEKEIKNKADIEVVLRECEVLRLAMTDGDCPYIVPLTFGYQEGSLFFHCAPEGRKIDLIKKNPKVCFEVDKILKFKKAKDACDWGLAYKSVIGTGKAVLLDSDEEKIRGLDVVMSHYSDRTFEYPKNVLDKTAVVKIRIDQMTGKQA